MHNFRQVFLQKNNATCISASRAINYSLPSPSMSHFSAPQQLRFAYNSCTLLRLLCDRLFFIIFPYMKTKYGFRCSIIPSNLCKRPDSLFILDFFFLAYYNKREEESKKREKEAR